MSFSLNHKGKPGDVAALIAADTSLPEGVKQFILSGVSALTSKAGVSDVSVSAHGHLHNGEEGNHDVTTATIKVEPVAAEKSETEELDNTNNAAGDGAQETQA